MVNKYRFTHIYKSELYGSATRPTDRVTLEFSDAEQLDEVLEKMRVFLLAVGFSPKGTLEFVEDED